MQPSWERSLDATSTGGCGIVFNVHEGAVDVFVLDEP